MPETTNPIVTAMLALATPLVPWLLARLSEYGGSRRLEYFRGRVELYDKLLEAAKDESLRKDLLIGKDREIRAIVDYIERRRGRVLGGSEGRPTTFSAVMAVAVGGAVVMFSTNTLLFEFPEAQVSARYVAAGLSLVAGAITVLRFPEWRRRWWFLIPVVATLVFILAFGLNTLGREATSPPVSTRIHP